MSSEIPTLPEPAFWHPVLSETNPRLLHAYSTRNGGVSREPYRSLNLGDHVGDDPEAVRENRSRLSQVLGIAAERWVTAEQVHGGEVAVVGDADAGLKILAVDGLATQTKNLPLALFYADCLSLYFYDPERQAIGLAHAGWKGTVAEIGPRTVKVMKEAFGSRPESLRVAFGPSIGLCCYEVGEAVASAFRRWDGAILEREGRLYADLIAANRAQLLAAGIEPEHLHAASLCTACHPETYYSYRRDGLTGRMAAVLMLR